MLSCYVTLVLCVVRTNGMLRGWSNITFESFIPHLIPSGPPSIVAVIYGYTPVFPGSVFNRTVVEKSPIVAWINYPKELYTLLLVDADSPLPDNPVLRTTVHWMVVNIPGCEEPRGHVIFPYLAPSPPSGLGAHRYLFLVFMQPWRIDPGLLRFKFSVSKYRRTGFDIVNFSYIYALGPPVAGNYLIGVFSNDDAGRPYYIFDNAEAVYRSYLEIK